MKILIAEDDKAIAHFTKSCLERAGYQNTIAYDGMQAADLIDQQDFDLVLLDIMLPEVDGYELMEYISPLGIPVIYITAKSGPDDIVKGLRLGALDYIVKPFEPMVLIARIENALRRTGADIALLEAWGIQFELEAHRAYRGNNEITLTPKETILLEIFLRNKGKALYRSTLYEKVWGLEDAEDTRALDVNINRIRKKLGWQEKLKTIPTVGYMLEKET